MGIALGLGLMEGAYCEAGLEMEMLQVAVLCLGMKLLLAMAKHKALVLHKARVKSLDMPSPAAQANALSPVQPP